MTALRLLLLAVAATCAFAEPSPSTLMPQATDHTTTWWKDGFPGRIEGAPWQRVVQTGRYAFVLDTASLQVPHLGPVPLGTAYGERLTDAELHTLPAAKLALEMAVDGKTYRCTAGAPWSRFAGPRLVESGRFFQRSDVTGLVFTADDGARLNVEARFETAAWPDRLAMVLAARPGRRALTAGEASFGRVGGGFGLDGTTPFVIPANPAHAPEKFTLELWAFVPDDYKAAQHSPWLVCRSHHEQADGNVGIVIQGGYPQGRLNIGGGRENAFVTGRESARKLRLEAWNHLALTYDGDTLRLTVNGMPAGEKKIGRKRTPVPAAITIGKRGDRTTSFNFHGVVDEIRLYDRALNLGEIRHRNARPGVPRPSLKPIGEWGFRKDGRASMTKLSEQWKQAAMEMRLGTAKGTHRKRWELPAGESWTSPTWHEVAIAFAPVAGSPAPPASPVGVKASARSGGAPFPVVYEPTPGWHRINLDKFEPTIPAGATAPSNDALERVKLVLTNPSSREEVARLMFEKTAHGFRQRIGTPITGISAILRDRDGHPTGIPVQLSKNWHNDSAGGVHAGQWFHGISQVRLPPAATVELELTLAYGHWGGAPAASHAQLSLIGWGGNSLWDQSALGSWGESICFDPNQVQAGCSITDVRPLMVRGKKDDGRWQWTNNVGGADFFRCFDPAGKRLPHAAMHATYHRVGPCLTEVTYAGRLGVGASFSNTVSLARTDDLVRATYRLRFDVTKPIEFSRFVLFQVGSDTYNSTNERKFAIGNEGGLQREWATQPGDNVYRTKPVALNGRIPWVSLHEAAAQSPSQVGAIANRGIVIREWKARLGGKEAAPWVAERGIKQHTPASIIDLLPPPGVTRLEPGDFVEATLEHLIIPQFAKDYYGPNQPLRAALALHENTWQMVYREAVTNERQVAMSRGTLERRHPDIRVRTDQGQAAFTLTGGLGHVPVTFTGLASHRGHTLLLDGKPVDQAVHGNDFWQADHDPVTKHWSLTYTLPVTHGKTHTLQLVPATPGQP